MPSAAEAQNLANWASEFGPGGSVWKGQSYPAGTAVTDIEFGNETSYTYQYSNNSASAYASRAQTYALRFKEAATAIQAVTPSVGLLAQGDSGGRGPEWVNQMFKHFKCGKEIHPLVSGVFKSSGVVICRMEIHPEEIETPVPHQTNEHSVPRSKVDCLGYFGK